MKKIILLLSATLLFTSCGVEKVKEVKSQDEIIYGFKMENIDYAKGLYSENEKEIKKLEIEKLNIDLEIESKKYVQELASGCADENRAGIVTNCEIVVNGILKNESVFDTLTEEDFMEEGDLNGGFEMNKIK